MMTKGELGMRFALWRHQMKTDFANEALMKANLASNMQLKLQSEAVARVRDASVRAVAVQFAESSSQAVRPSIALAARIESASFLLRTSTN